MTSTKNLQSLALLDTSASSGKWGSTSEGRVRSVFHYGTLMMEIALGSNGRPLRTVEPLDAILYTRPNGSQSDKCGLSRIRYGILSG